MPQLVAHSIPRAPATMPPPLIGYKMLKDSAGRYVLATLRLSPTAPIIRTGYQVRHRGQVNPDNAAWLMRTSTVCPIKMVPVISPKEHLFAAYSLRTPTFKYPLGKWIDTPLDTTAEFGQGIHFFEVEAAARMWSSLFGK